MLNSAGDVMHSAYRHKASFAPPPPEKIKKYVEIFCLQRQVGVAPIQGFSGGPELNGDSNKIQSGIGHHPWSSENLKNWSKFDEKSEFPKIFAYAVQFKFHIHVL